MAYEDKVRPGAKPQRITMEERARLTVTGVEEVLSFDTERIVMRTVLGEEPLDPTLEVFDDDAGW